MSEVNRQWKKIAQSDQFYFLLNRFVAKYTRALLSLGSNDSRMHCRKSTSIYWLAILNKNGFWNMKPWLCCSGHQTHQISVPLNNYVMCLTKLALHIFSYIMWLLTFWHEIPEEEFWDLVESLPDCKSCFAGTWSTDPLLGKCSCFPSLCI